MARSEWDKHKRYSCVQFNVFWKRKRKSVRDKDFGVEDKNFGNELKCDNIANHLKEKWPLKQIQWVYHITRQKLTVWNIDIYSLSFILSCEFINSIYANLKYQWKWNILNQSSKTEQTKQCVKRSKTKSNHHRLRTILMTKLTEKQKVLIQYSDIYDCNERLPR